MNIDKYLSTWKQLLWIESPENSKIGRYTTLIDFPVILPFDVTNSIREQLINLKGKECVYFIPGANDWDLMGYPNKCDGFVGDIVYNPQFKILTDSQIVGSLYDVAETDDLHVSKHHLYVKVNIKNDFKNILPFRGYQLHIGLNSDFTTWEDYQIDNGGYKKNVIKSCVVKGVYWKEMPNNNHRFGECFMAPYYNQRNLGLYVYEPGRCYW